MNKVNKRANQQTGTSLSMNDLAVHLKREHRFYGLSEPPATLYIVVAGDDQTPCRWNGRQLVIEWIDDAGIPVFSHDQAVALIDQTYQFFNSIGRTARPILRAVPVFNLQSVKGQSILM